MIAQLVSNGYDNVVIIDEADLLLNLKSQLEKHNSKTISDGDFQQIFKHLTKSNNVFEKAKVLRDWFVYYRQQCRANQWFVQTLTTKSLIYFVA